MRFNEEGASLTEDNMLVMRSVLVEVMAICSVCISHISVASLQISWPGFGAEQIFKVMFEGLLAARDCQGDM